MKKILIVFLLLFAAVNVNAQIEIGFGIKGGYNSSNFTNSNLDALSGVYLGVILPIKFVDFYTLQPELTYTGQGAQSDFDVIDDLEISYLSFTVNNKFNLPGLMGFQLMAGPSVDIKVKDEGFFEDPESFDFTIMAGLGYKFPLGLTVEMRYKLGLVDIFGSNINNTSPIDEVILNQVFQVGLSYQFKL